MKKAFSIFIVITLLAAAICFGGCNKLGGDKTEAQKSTIYDLGLNLSGNTMSVCETIYYTNNANTPLSEFKLHLYPNAFSEEASRSPISDEYQLNCFDRGNSYGSILIDEVKIDGEKAKFELENENCILKISLETPLKEKQEALVNINASVTIPYCTARFGITKQSVNLGNFYPIMCVYENDKGFITDPYYQVGDPFYSETSDYFVSLTTDYEGIIATSGVKELTSKNSPYVYEITAEKTRDFAMAIVFDGKSLSKTVGDTTLCYTYFKDEMPELSLETAAIALKTFNESFGVYPYPTLNVVETQFVYGGMEYPNLVYVASKLNENDKHYTIVHEIAHQWWYGVVGSNQVAYPWLDEGLTEFSTALFYKLNNNPSAYSATIASANSRLTALTLKNGDTCFDLSLGLDGFTNESVYVSTTYDKGMLLFNSLYCLLGEKNFLAALKFYASENAYKIATPQKLYDALDKVQAGSSTLAKQWINGSVQ